MCGLLTFISARGAAHDHRDPVARALESLHHRGPDETAVEQVGPAAVLGFKRLSVIDVEHSHQPLRYADGRYALTFNGEVYNYVELRAELTREHGATFATRGDGEVILAAYHHWGPAGVRRLRGMFAFVIWDSQEGVAFAARDPFGIKPLYHLSTPDGLYLASEKKSLLPFVDTAALDETGLSHYLTLQFVPEPGTLTPGVRRLPAGSRLRYRPGGEPEVERYWRPDFRPTPVSAPARLYRDIREALRDSVRVHMRADVPVGAFLSSGIDSTACVALAREVNPNILTFTAALAVPGYSELEAAGETAKRLDVTNHPVEVTAEMMMQALPRIVWYLDDPVADPALVPLYFVARTASEHVTVALSGEGADELFAGYPIYREPRSLRPVTALPAPLRRGLRSLSRLLPAGVPGRGYLERGTTPLPERHFGNGQVFSPREKALLRHGRPGVPATEATRAAYAEAAHLPDVTTMQYVDLHTWLRGDILVKSDRMAMANSLEVRVPFLDYRVFDLAARIPVALNLPPRSDLTKQALRRAMAGVLPPDVVNRRKLGFPTPIRVWLRNEMYEWARHVLATSGAGELLDLGYADRLLREHRLGSADHSRKIWAVLVFCLWYAVFVDGSLDPRVERNRSPLARKPALVRDR